MCPRRMPIGWAENPPSFRSSDSSHALSTTEMAANNYDSYYKESRRNSPSFTLLLIPPITAQSLNFLDVI